MYTPFPCHRDGMTLRSRKRDPLTGRLTLVRVSSVTTASAISELLSLTMILPSGYHIINSLRAGPAVEMHDDGGIVDGVAC